MLRPFQASLSFNRVFTSCDREINRSFSSKRIGSINFVKVEFEKIFDNLIVDNEVPDERQRHFPKRIEEEEFSKKKYKLRRDRIRKNII